MVNTINHTPQLSSMKRKKGSQLRTMTRGMRVDLERREREMINQERIKRTKE